MRRIVRSFFTQITVTLRNVPGSSLTIVPLSSVVPADDLPRWDAVLKPPKPEIRPAQPVLDRAIEFEAGQ